MIISFFPVAWSTHQKEATPMKSRHTATSHWSPWRLRYVFFICSLEFFLNVFVCLLLLLSLNAIECMYKLCGAHWMVSRSRNLLTWSISARFASHCWLSQFRLHFVLAFASCSNAFFLCLLRIWFRIKRF